MEIIITKLKKSNIKNAGNGLFATENIKKGCILSLSPHINDKLEFNRVLFENGKKL